MSSSTNLPGSPLPPSQEPCDDHPVTPTISIIIPVLNEGLHLPRSLESCLREGAEEVIVVDGSSTDNTLEVVSRFGVLHTCLDRAQRSSQLNAGGAMASGDLLVFLHADTVLEPGALAALRQRAQKSLAVGGGFYRTFENAPGLVAVASVLGNFRGRMWGWYFGDQAIWCRSGAFAEVGGYPEKPRFEDLDFCRRLKRIGPLVQIQPGIKTSARRFREHPGRTVIRDFCLTVRHLLFPNGL